MTPWLSHAAEAWWEWMAAMSVQVSLLVAVVALADWVLRRWVWPQLLMALWLVVMAKLLLPPTLVSPTAIRQLVPDSVATGLSPTAHAAATASSTAMLLIAFVVWLAGLVIFAGLGCYRYARMRRQWLGPKRPLPKWLEAMTRDISRRMGFRQTVAVRLADNNLGAALVGFVRPVIVLPKSLMRDATRQQVEHVLLHEMAHVKRRDAWWSLAFLLIQLMYWFHPLVWLARRRLATLREICCDQMAVRGLGTSPYRETLLRLARPLVERSTAAPMAFVGRRSQLLARLEWLDRRQTAATWRRHLCTTLVVGTLITCGVPMARSDVSVVPAVDSKLPDRGSSQAPSANQVTTVSLPPLDDLRGCLQRRYLILGILAQQESAAASSTLE